MKKAVDHLKKSDAVLASIIARVGPCKMIYREPTFEMLARAIVFQQLSTKAARTIYGRLEEAAGGALTPRSIQGLSVGEMRRAGLSRQKLGYIRDLAEHALSGKVDFARLPGMSDDEVIVSLTDIKGVGVWTAHMFLLFSLRTWACAWPSSGPIVNASCPRRSRWSRSPRAGTLIAVTRPGICGGAWNYRRWKGLTTEGHREKQSHKTSADLCVLCG
jgi:hypothetical protein